MLTEEQIAMLTAMVAVALNKTQDQITAMVTADNAETPALRTLVKTKITEVRQEGEKKGVILFKKAVKKKLAVSLDDSVEDIDEIVEAVNEAIVKKAEAEPDEAKIKASQLFKDLALAVVNKDKEIESIKANNLKDLDRRDARTEILKYAQENGAVIPEDKATAERKFKMLEREVFEGVDLEKTEKGFFLKNDKGEYILNDKGHNKTLAEAVKELLPAVYTLTQVQQRQNGDPTPPANPLNPNPPGGRYKAFIPGTHAPEPKTLDDLMKIKTSDNIPGAAKMEVQRIWDEDHKAA